MACKVVVKHKVIETYDKRVKLGGGGGFTIGKVKVFLHVIRRLLGNVEVGFPKQPAINYTAHNDTRRHTSPLRGWNPYPALFFFRHTSRKDVICVPRPLHLRRGRFCSSKLDALDGFVLLTAADVPH